MTESYPGQSPSLRERAIPGHETLILGTRGSALALHQAQIVASLLGAIDSAIEVRIQAVSSEGDADKVSPLTEIGGRGVFTSSLQRALTRGEIDAAVHSCKDVPSISATGLSLAAFPQREDSRDALVSRHGTALAQLPPNPVVGTSSRRRAVQILERRPDAKLLDIRGNIDTRLRKAAAEPYDAVVLAAAGLARMGWRDRIVELLPVEAFTPAPGQGALVVETREAPDPVERIVAEIDDPYVRMALEVERSFLRGIGGGCTTPLGAHAEVGTIHGHVRIRFHAMLARDDGHGLTRTYEEWPLDGAIERAFDTAKAMVRHVRPNSVSGGGIETTRQLRGQKVIATGTEALVDAVVAEIMRRGGEPVVVPTIRIAPPADSQPLIDAKRSLQGGDFDWLIFTSRQAVLSFRDVLPQAALGPIRIAAIGPSTQQALVECGIAADVVAEDSKQEGMLSAMLPVLRKGDRVLLPTSDRARSVLSNGLTAHGAIVSDVAAYQTQLVERPSADVVNMVQRGEIGAVLLASPSAVEAFILQLGSLLPVMSGASFVAIGDVTAKAMSDHGLPVHAVAKTPGSIEMVDALAEYLWGDHRSTTVDISSVGAPGAGKKDGL